MNTTNEGIDPRVDGMGANPIPFHSGGQCSSAYAVIAYRFREKTGSASMRPMSVVDVPSRLFFAGFYDAL